MTDQVFVWSAQEMRWKRDGWEARKAAIDAAAALMTSRKGRTS